ncbi:sensor histidine kinase [Anaerosphaera multitolerans]|uniref:histidine kinase n=1 Tax=Anaerosphaera multitolerans TaxID=2487351 RepID=A0A437S9B8_9FIRM|nr:HAMP domain-containing sensor histidine kinase [Anaerosphaera multitolerans]RVU55720.1 GHKL domain-containing protein [Anaerosphaera multitolerans]
MIRSLKIKFITIIMGVLTAVFIGIFVVLNIFMQSKSSEQTGKLLMLIAQQDGVEFLQDFRRDYFRDDFFKSPDFGINTLDLSPAARASRIFYVKIDQSNRVFEFHLDMITGLSIEDAKSYLEDALTKNKKQGFIDNFQYLIADKDYGKMIIFAEKSIETQLLNQLMDVSLKVAIFSLAIFFILSIYLSNWAIKPVKTAFENQKQFISDASHELKTPLTIISTNVDVLENEIGKNKRLEDIKSQTNRMNLLIKELLSLAKTDEGKADLEFKNFNVSQAILNSSLEFESRAFEEGKNLEIEVKENIFYKGNEDKIKQLCSILIDNAIKHSQDNGDIKVRFKKESSKLHFSVYNTGTGIPESEREKVFERFYRSDSSRSRDTGGYGLGLSIAKSIVEIHRGKIYITGEYGSWIQFNVIL